MHYEIALYQPVAHGDNWQWCADVYTVGGGGRCRQHCGAAHDFIPDALREAERFITETRRSELLKGHRQRQPVD